MIRNAFCAVLILGVVGSSSLPSYAEGQRLTLAGSSTILPIAEIAAQQYENLHPGIIIDVQGGGSSVGISSARTGLANIGMVSRALHPEESDLHPTRIALDGLAIIVHEKNPLKSINRKEVIDVYSGKIKNWKDPKGEDAVVTVINKEEGRATLELFEKYFKLKGKFVRNAIIIGPNGQAIASVAGNAHAIAYVSIGAASVAEEEGTPIKRLALDGIEATVENVKNESYGLRRELNLVTKEIPSGLAKDFIDFLLGPQGRKIIIQEEFVPLGG